MEGNNQEQPTTVVKLREIPLSTPDGLIPRSGRTTYKLVKRSETFGQELPNHTQIGHLLKRLQVPKRTQSELLGIPANVPNQLVEPMINQLVQGLSPDRCQNYRSSRNESNLCWNVYF